jgi:hypothetical protein
MTAKASVIVSEFLRAFMSGEVDKARGMVRDDFYFHAPLHEGRGDKGAYFAGARCAARVVLMGDSSTSSARQCGPTQKKCIPAGPHLAQVKTLRSQKLRVLPTCRKLLRSKAIAIQSNLLGSLRNFGLRVGVVEAAKFEVRISGLVENLPDLAHA